MSDLEPDVSALPPLPFEDPAVYPTPWARYWGTLKLPFTDPRGFFARIETGAGLRRPLLFAFLTSLPVYLFLCIYPLMFGAMGLITRRLEPMPPGGPPPFHWIALGCGGLLLVAPALQVALILGHGLLQHGLLWIWGAGRGPGLHQTLRTVAYLHGFAALALWTPLGPIAFLAVLVFLGLGLAWRRNTAPWRGIAAALTPGLLACCAFLGLFMVPLLFLPKPTATVQERVEDVSVRAQVELTRQTMVRLPKAGEDPEVFARRVLAMKGFDYPEARNPYGGTESPFQLGTPTEPGKVGLVPVHHYLDPATGQRHRAAVLVIGKLGAGETRALVPLD